MRDRLPTLRFRLSLRALLYTLLALAFVGAAGWLAADRVISERIATSAEDYLLTLTGELEIASSPTDPNVAAPIRQAGGDRIAQIVHLEDGAVMISTPGLSDESLIDPANFSQDQATSVELPHPLEDGVRIVARTRAVAVLGETYGVIAGVSTGSSSFGSVAMLIGGAGAALLIALGLAVGVWLSVRSALKPVEKLADEADHVASDSSSESWAVQSLATTAEIDHLIDRLNSLLTRVHESQEHERAFLEDASHDLRTPIAVARAELDLARSNTSENTTRDALESAIEELDRLDRLAADLLILARMRAQPARASENVHVGHMVRKTAARMVRDPHHRELRVTVEGNADARGDPFTLERAFDNVLVNAVKHASEHVAVEIQSSEDIVSVRVRDDGPGFPKPMLASATRRFERHGNREEGTGLGLSIAAAIAEAHGGSLTFGNRPEGGAEVTLLLPTTRGARKLDTVAGRPEVR